MLHWRTVAKLTSFCAVALLAGCAADAATDDGEAGAEEELNALSVTLGGASDAVTVDDRPRLERRARGGLACDRRFDIEGRTRLTCARGRESLEVLVRKSEGEAVLIHRKDGANSDRRATFACTISGSGPDGLPAKLACSAKSASTSGGGLSSPFASTVSGIDIPNTHLVGSSGKLLRGMAPRSDEEMNQLVAAGVGAVLVFKNQTGSGSDVADEITKLGELGIAPSRAENIPFPWKDLPNFVDPCMQTLAALKFVRTNLAANRKTFFHCTVGEDRTGMLAALHRLVTEADLDPAEAWDGEMCERGYGAGNPLKPAFVRAKLDDGLTPLYRKLAYLAKKGALDALDASVCETDPSTEPDFDASAVPLDRLTCGASTMFEP